MPYTKLKQLRLQHNWTQKQVAEKLYISQNAYSKMETGETRLKLDHIQALARIYNKEPEYFLVHSSKVTGSEDTAINKAPVNNMEDICCCHKELVDKLLAAKDEVIQSKVETIEALKLAVQQLQARISHE